MAEGQIEYWQRKDMPDIQVEAVRLTEDNAVEVAVWCGGTLVDEIDPEHPDEKQPGINLNTHMGVKRASLHMYVVKAGEGFFTTSNRRFESIFEPVARHSTPLESAGDTRKRLGFADPFDSGRFCS